jgi:acetyl esterase/lipase
MRTTNLFLGETDGGEQSRNINKKVLGTVLALFATTALGVATDALNVCYDGITNCSPAHKADIYGAATSGSPIIVLIHGGGFVGGSKGNLTSVAQDLQSYG